MEETLTNSWLPYIWLILAWGVYFFGHSLFASDSIKKKLTAWGLSLRTQRIIYVIMSIVGLFALLLINGVVGGQPLIPKSEFLKIAALFFGGGGVLILNTAFKQYNVSGFLGFSEEKGTLKMDGILGFIRHPLYTATILISIGFFLFDPRLASLVSVLCIYIYLFIGIRLEEKKLIKKYGQLYIEYKEEVPPLFPNIFTLFKHITKN